MSPDVPETHVGGGARRWEGDERGLGVNSTAQATAPVEELLRDMRRSGWVSEDARGQLAPKLDAWLRSAAGDLWSVTAVTVDGSVLVIDAVWRRPSGRMRDLRADAFALIGSFAENSTHVRQRVDGSTVVYDVATGQPAGEFEHHGHLVTVRISGTDVDRVVAGAPQARGSEGSP